MKLSLVGILLAVFFLGSLLAHEGEKHNDKAAQTPPVAVYEAINQAYLKDVKPIFEAKCHDCHGSGKPLPWYAGLPVIKWLIEYDIREAKEHLDFSDDFPFTGQGTPAEDLKAILKSTKQQNMPPLRYLIMHWNSGLTEVDRQAIDYWAKEGLRVLSQQTPDIE